MRNLEAAWIVPLCAVLLLGGNSGGPPEDLPDGPPIQNPYFPNAKWRVWRDDKTPIKKVNTLVRDGKKKKPATITLAPTPTAKRIYPSGPLREGKEIRWKTLATPSKR